jgi:hypothetical protein
VSIWNADLSASTRSSERSTVDPSRRLAAFQGGGDHPDETTGDVGVSKISWTTGVLVDGPLAGTRQVYCENRIDATVHFEGDTVYKVTKLTDADRPAELTHFIPSSPAEHD